MEYRMKERTIGGLLAAKARENSNRTFLMFEDVEVSFSRLNDTASAVAAGLRQLGVRKGDPVCIMLPNSLEFVYSWLGLARLGAMEVPINIAHKGELLAYLINNCGARIIIIERSLAEQLDQIREKVPVLSTVVVYDQFRQGLPVMEGFTVYDFTVLFEPEISVRTDISTESVYDYDPFCVLYTSGTTGTSKGVTMPQNYAVHLGELIASAMEYTQDDTVYICLPLFHGNAQFLGIMPALVADAKIVLGRRFSASTFWDEISRCRATAFNYIGGMITILHKQPPRPDDADNTLRVCFGAAAPKNVWESFEERFGVTILEGYGSTECGIVTMNTMASRMAGSMGKEHPAYEVRIVDDSDHEVSPGVVGEVVTRPRIPWTMMTGYYKMPDKTAEVCRNLWFHTGDYAFRDEEGYFHFVDRKKDAIRRKGENISSYEVEKVVNMHPAVLESAVVAAPSELGEDEVKIVVVLKSGEKLSPEELIAFCDQNMAFYMVPRYVEFRDRLPKTPTERVEKYKLKVEGITPGTWDRVAAGVRLIRERY